MPRCSGMRGVQNIQDAEEILLRGRSWCIPRDPSNFAGNLAGKTYAQRALPLHTLPWRQNRGQHDHSSTSTC